MEITQSSSVRSSKFAVRSIRFCLIVLLAVGANKAAQAKCSFEVSVRGQNGKSYNNEAEGLAAAKRYTFDGLESYLAPTSIKELCAGRYLSYDLFFVKGGGPGEFRSCGENDPINLADQILVGTSILAQTTVYPVCAGSLDNPRGPYTRIVSTRTNTCSWGERLRCTPTPSLTVSFIGTKEIRPMGTGGNSVAALVAKVMDGTAPKAGVAVQFTAEVTANSGGHDHEAVGRPDPTRPKGTLSIAQGTTDANGEVKLTFSAQLAAGIHTVKATCADCTNSPASLEVKVKVPGLVEMPPDTKMPPSYNLVGVITGVHNSSHWFSLDSRNTLYKIVDTMFKTGWGTVGVNDGSLVWGGVFDINRNWKPSHSGHRTGNEVDLSFVNPKAIREAQRRATYTELCKKENTAFSVQTLWHQDDGYAPHFHLYLDGAGLTSQAKGGPCCESYKTTRPKKKKDGSPVLDASGNPVQEIVALCEETSPR